MLKIENNSDFRNEIINNGLERAKLFSWKNTATNLLKLYEEVYKDRYYGTLKSQVDAQLEKGENVVCDVDVLGGLNIKKHYGDRALSVFIQPPSVKELRNRLISRGTDELSVIEDRIARAEFELSHASQFDVVIVNDNLETALAEALKKVQTFVQA